MYVSQSICQKWQTRTCRSEKEQRFDEKDLHGEGVGSGRIFQFWTNGVGLKRRVEVRRDVQRKSQNLN
jgi:hypothetical protein